MYAEMPLPQERTQALGQQQHMRNLSLFTAAPNVAHSFPPCQGSGGRLASSTVRLRRRVCARRPQRRRPSSVKDLLPG
jgi:hypothetical protein